MNKQNHFFSSSKFLFSFFYTVKNIYTKTYITLASIEGKEKNLWFFVRRVARLPKIEKRRNLLKSLNDATNKTT